MGKEHIHAKKAHVHSALDAFLAQAEHESDDLWAKLTAWQPAGFEKHHFTAEELHDRLITFAAGAGACFTLLGIFAILAVSRRRYGSLPRAYLAITASISASIEKLQQARNRGYLYHAVVAPVDEEEDEEVVEEEWVKSMEDRWIKRSCTPRRQRGLQPDRFPTDYFGHISEEAKAKDKAKLVAKIAALREKNGGELPEDMKHLEQEEEALPKAAEAPGKLKQATEPAISAEEREELFRIQVEEFRDKHNTGGSRFFANSIFYLKMPISALLYMLYAATCVGIPLLAAKSASCSQGFPWEAHVPFLGVFLVVKFWELFLFTYDDSVPGQLGMFEFVIKFGSSFLGFMDGYSDAVAIVIAHACGSDLWYWMAFFYVFGVIFMQWFVMGILALWLDSSGTCFFKMMHMDALSLCCTMAPTDKHALLVWKFVNIFRTVFEDVPQCILQLMFIHYVKRNYIMMISVVIGVATSFLAVSAALKRAAEAAGTNWERLQALGTMNRALNDGDMKAFSNAAATAEADKTVDADEIHSQWAKAEVQFDLPCGRRFFHTTNETPSDQIRSLLERPQQNESHYGDACRTVTFAKEAAEAREAFWKKAEAIESSPFKRGEHHEARYIKKVYESQRRTVEWAIQMQEEREARIQAMLVDAPAK